MGKRSGLSEWQQEDCFRAKEITSHLTSSLSLIAGWFHHPSHHTSANGAIIINVPPSIAHDATSFDGDTSSGNTVAASFQAARFLPQDVIGCLERHIDSKLAFPNANHEHEHTEKETRKEQTPPTSTPTNGSTRDEETEESGEVLHS